MTAAELEAIARDIVPPVGASFAIALVDENMKHRAAFLVDGRIRSAPVGPAYDKPRQAIALVRYLNGERPASRPAPRPVLTVDVLGSVDGSFEDVAATPPEAPDAKAATSTCAGCGGPLPPGRHGQRRQTCGDRCRRRAARARAAADAQPEDVGAGLDLVTPSRPSAADPSLGL